MAKKQIVRRIRRQTTLTPEERQRLREIREKVTGKLLTLDGRQAIEWGFAEIEAGKHDFTSLEKYMLAKGEITPNTSGRQELFENVVNRYVM